jgi:hypothetical protein
LADRDDPDLGAIGALDQLGLPLVPIFLGDGRRLTPMLSVDTLLTLESERPLPGGSVEMAYACS